jgi:hypothetical protein
MTFAAHLLFKSCLPNIRLETRIEKPAKRNQTRKIAIKRAKRARITGGYVP